MSNGEQGYIWVDDLIYNTNLKKFFRDNNFKPSNPSEIDLENFLDPYGVDFNLFVEKDITSKAKKNKYKIPNICEEILVAMKKTYDEKQSIYTKDTKNITAYDLKKHNKLVYEEIEKFPNINKNRIKNSDCYKFNKKLDEYIDMLMNRVQVLFMIVLSESNLDLGNQMEEVINLFDQLILSYAKSLLDKEKITKDMKERGEIASINKNSISKINENYLNKKTGYLLDNELKRELIKNIKINNEIKEVLKEKDQTFRRGFKENMIDSNCILEWYSKEIKKDEAEDIVEDYNYKKNIDPYLNFPHNIVDILINEFNSQMSKIVKLCIFTYEQIIYDVISSPLESVEFWMPGCKYDDFGKYLELFKIYYEDKYKEIVFENYIDKYEILFFRYGFISNDPKINLFGFYKNIVQNIIKEESIKYFYFIFEKYKEEIVYAIKNEQYKIFDEFINNEIYQRASILEFNIKKAIERYLCEGCEKDAVSEYNKKLEEVYNKIKSIYKDMEDQNKRLQDLIDEREELQSKLDRLDKKTQKYKDLKKEIEKKDDVIRKTRDMRTSISHIIGQSLVYAIEKDKKYMSSQIVNKDNLYKNI